MQENYKKMKNENNEISNIEQDEILEIEDE
jgi:hypothetical protein